MKEELKKSLRTYGALLLLGVTGVPLGAAVGLIEALFCRLLLKVTAVRVAHLFWCLPFLAMAGLVIVAVNQKFGGRGKGGMSLIFDVAYEEETELPLRMIPLSMLPTALTHLFGGSAGREGVAVQNLQKIRITVVIFPDISQFCVNAFYKNAYCPFHAVFH